MAATGTYSVAYLKTLNFPALPREEQIKIKKIGRPTPHLIGAKNRNVSNATQIFEKFSWLCRCAETGNFHCYPCLLYDEKSSYVKGMMESKGLDGHTKRPEHISACLELALIETKTVTADPKQNKHLGNILDCMKLCGIHEDALEILLETKKLTKPPKNVSDDLYDCILDIVRNEIKNEIRQTEFVSVLLEGVSDISSYDEAVIFRYVHKGSVKERFYGLISDLDIWNVLKEVIDNPKKLTAQIYNPKFYNLGYVYKNCISVHYPPWNRPETILARAMIQDVETRLFFARVDQICRYYPEENISTINKNRNILENDLKKIRDTSKKTSEITTAIAILDSLNNQEFLSIMDLYSEVLQHIETLHEESLLSIPSASDKFTEALQSILSLKGRTISEITRCNIVLGFSKVSAFKSAEDILSPQKWKTVSSTMICEACNLYSFLGVSTKQVKVELQILEQNPTVANLNGFGELFKFLTDNELKSVVPNVYTLALLVITSPAMDQDGKKLERIRKLVENCNEKHRKLNARVMLSVEKEFVMDLPEFNNKVIEAYNVKTSESNKWEFNHQPEPAPSMASSNPPVLIQIPQLLIHVPVPLPVQCKIEPEDPIDQDEVPLDQISGSEADEVKNFPTEPGNIERDPLAIDDQEYVEPVSREFVSESDARVQKPPLKKTKRDVL